MNKTREEMIEWHRIYCTHYDGRATIQPPYACRAGVKYATVGRFSAVIAGKEKEAEARPCVNGHLMTDALNRCSKWQRVTQEEAEAKVAEMEAAERRIKLVWPVVGAWRVKGRPEKDRTEVIECPACNGKLHLSQAAYNGHVHGHCETPECVSWME